LDGRHIIGARLSTSTGVSWRGVKCLPEANLPSVPSVVHSDPEILGGVPVFVGTRVPFRNLIDYLEGGYTLEEFLDAFPSVTRAQAIAALEAAHEAVSGRAHPAR
jgi:uncharacterized protein (DUF433 family)